MSVACLVFDEVSAACSRVDELELRTGDGRAICSPGVMRLRCPSAGASDEDMRLLTRAHNVSENRRRLLMAALDGI